MAPFDDMFKALIAAAGATIIAIFGPPFAQIFGLLLALMLLDLLSAILANGRAGKIDPAVGYAGWRRKVMTVLVVLAVPIANEVASSVGVPGLTDLPAGAAVAGGFCLVELLSIIRNAGLCGVKLPITVSASLVQPPDQPPGEPPIVPHG